MDTKSYVDSQRDRFIEELQAWCRQPSVSTTGQGIAEMADLVLKRLAEAGLSTRLMPVSNGYPVVYAERKGTCSKTLLFYNHYDVQPPEPLDAWHSPPFAAEIRENTLFARGAADNKGCLLSRIQAVEAILRTCRELPVCVKFLIEGEEEVGSPHLHSFVEDHKALLIADGCIWEYAAKNELGYPTMTLGNKGMCFLELTAKGPKQDWHSMYAPIIPNPAWRLAWALSSLKNEHEDILVEGFYDDVEPMTDYELEVLDKIPANEEKLRAEAGLDHLLQGVSGRDLKKGLYGMPTCTICGITSGHMGSGRKTIVPAEATARVDIRLVVHQRPDDILAKVRRHFVAHGFGDILVEMTHGVVPAKTPVDSPFVEVVAGAARQVYPQEIVVLPTSPGTGPRDVFSTWTSMPIVGLGVAHVGSSVHGPNENVRLDDYTQGIKHIAATMWALASPSK